MKTMEMKTTAISARAEKKKVQGEKGGKERDALAANIDFTCALLGIVWYVTIKFRN